LDSWSDERPQEEQVARRADKASARRQEILEGFYEVIAAEGMEKASNAKIAKHLGMNTSLIYHYFTSRDEMIIELVRYITEKYVGDFAPLVLEEADPEERLTLILDTLFSRDWFLEVNPLVYYECFILSLRNERVRESFRRHYEVLRQWLIWELSDLMERGVVAGRDAERLADTVIALLEGYDLYGLLLQDEERSSDLAESLKQSALTLLKKGQGA
jgi:AcrR family transcriptional regulator